MQAYEALCIILNGKFSREGIAIIQNAMLADNRLLN